MKKQTTYRFIAMILYNPTIEHRGGHDDCWNEWVRLECPRVKLYCDASRGKGVGGGDNRIARREVAVEWRGAEAVT